MHGKGRFIITGMEKVTQQNKEDMADDDDRTMNVKSLGSDTTGRITIGTYQLGNADFSHSETRVEDTSASEHANSGTAAGISTTDEDGWTHTGTADDRKRLELQMLQGRDPAGGNRGQRP